MIRSIRIDNNTAEDIFDARIQISASPSFCKGYQKIISIIPAKSQVEIKDIDIVMDAEYLAGLTEKVTGNLAVELGTEEKVICSENLAVSVLAFNEWHGYRIFPELLAAFVTPNHPAVNKIIARAVHFLEEWTRDPSLDAYQSKDTNRVLTQAAAVYKALQELIIFWKDNGFLSVFKKVHHNIVIAGVFLLVLENLLMQSGKYLEKRIRRITTD